jgi:hypothetical protein
LGINKEVRRASYIAHWIELLKHDDRAFFTAASKAQKAADFLRGLALMENPKELSHEIIDGRAENQTPVVKFFNPVGSATWLISEMDPDNHDWLFGLCDLGFQCPELGTVSLHELEGITLKSGLKIERDLHFKASHPMSYYADRARNMGYIDA